MSLKDGPGEGGWAVFAEKVVAERDALTEENGKLKAAIRSHRDERGHDRCWLDDQKLYAVLGEGGADGTLPPRAEFLSNCERYYDIRRDKGEWTPTSERDFAIARAQQAEAALVDERRMYEEMKEQRNEAHLRWEALGKKYDADLAALKDSVSPACMVSEIVATQADRAETKFNLLSAMVKKVCDAAIIPYTTEEGVVTFPIPALLLLNLKKGAEGVEMLMPGKRAWNADAAIQAAEAAGKVGTLEDLVKLCDETNDCLFYVISEGDTVFSFSHEQLDNLAKGKPIEPDRKFELEVAHRAYNRGFGDAGGDIEDGAMDDWERNMLTDLIEEVRRGE